MPTQIVCHLAAAGGVADMDGVFQAEMRRQRRQVIGIMVHIVAVAGLGRATVATAVMGDNAIAMTEEEQHLRVPVIGRQWPAVAEHDRLGRVAGMVGIWRRRNLLIGTRPKRRPASRQETTPWKRVSQRPQRSHSWVRIGLTR